MLKSIPAPDEAPDPGEVSETGRVPDVPRTPRDVRLDVIRGVAITLIIVQHLGWASLTYGPAPGLTETFPGTWGDASKLGPFWYWALALSAPFCVQVFAFVSGYLLAGSSVRTFGAFVRSRFLTLMVPFMAWAFVYWLDPQTRLFFVHKGGLLRFMLAAIWNPNGGVVGPVWFLPMLFLSSAAVFGVRRMFPGTAALLMLAVAAILFPRAWGGLGLGYPPFGLLEVARFVPFVVLGAIMRSRGALRWKANVKRLAIAVTTYAACVYLTSRLATPFARLPQPWNIVMVVVRQDLAGLFLTTIGIWMCVELVALLPARSLPPLAWLGVNSLGICGAQLPAIALLVSLGLSSPWVVFPATLALCVGACWLLGTNEATSIAFLGGRSAASAGTAPLSASPNPE